MKNLIPIPPFQSPTMPVPKSLYTVLSCHFSTNAKLPKLPRFSKIPSKYRSRSIQEAQKALIDYLHTTRSLPFTYAEHIGKNSLFSLSKLTENIDFSAPNFSRSFEKFLRYHPINEFEFLFESIGIDYKEIGEFLPVNKFFFYEDRSILDAACALSGFGFPWNRLGKLYEEEISIFCKSASELTSRLNGLKHYGFNTVSVIGICLAFPHVLTGEADSGGEIAALLDGLKKDILEFGMGDGIEGNIDFCYETCKKFRLFYNLDIEMGKVGEQMSRNKSIFIECPEEVLTQNAEYFCRFDVKKKDVGLLLIHNPEILCLDLNTPMISVLGLLKHVGLGTKELNYVIDKYSHVLGRNKLANLPSVMRALDLHKWFFYEIRNDYQLLASYCLNSPDEDVDEDFINSLENIQLSRTPTHTMNKLNFLHGIGYGENSLTGKVLTRLHGTDKELQERFDCLLLLGIEFSKLCLMIRITPKILNQKPEILKQKVYFLCHEIGSSLQYLDVFPAFLCFDLENRMKPRYRFHMWLTKKGLCTRDYSIASIMATSEKNFVARLFGIHPAAPKHWFESFSYKRSTENCL